MTRVCLVFEVSLMYIIFAWALDSLFLCIAKRSRKLNRRKQIQRSKSKRVTLLFALKQIWTGNVSYNFTSGYRNVSEDQDDQTLYSLVHLICIVLGFVCWLLMFSRT